MKIHGVQNDILAGYIYLVENKVYSGWIKCGMTTNLTVRINSYNGNDPLKRFKLLKSKSVDNRRSSETRLIYDLKSKSTLERGEWFRISKDDALEIFNKIN